MSVLYKIADKAPDVLDAEKAVVKVVKRLATVCKTMGECEGYELRGN
jgi:hypothetical protein